MKALLEVDICTWHLFNAKQMIPGEVSIPFTYTRLPNGGFILSYDPDGSKETEEEVGHACHATCAERITSKLTEISDWIEATMVEPLKNEREVEKANAMEVDDTPEGYDQGDENEEEEEEEENGGELDGQEQEEEGSAGDPVAETYKKIQEGQKVIPSGVINPKPEQADEDARIPESEEGLEFTEDGWKRYFPEGYVPKSKPAPKDEERVACKAWWDSLSDGRKGLVGNFTPRLSSELTFFWRKSRDYADFIGAKV